MVTDTIMGPIGGVEWDCQREELGIIDGTGKGIRIKLAGPVSGNRNKNEPLRTARSGMENTIILYE